MAKYQNLKNNIKAISEQLDWGDYYNLLALPGGLCFGLAHMWVQAVLANDTQTFYKRLDILTRDYGGSSGNSLINQIKQYQNSRKGTLKQPYDPRNPICEIRAFLDGLLLYHSPKSIPASFQPELKFNLMNQSYLASHHVISQTLGFPDETVPDDKTSKPLQRIFHITICGNANTIGAEINTIFEKTREDLGPSITFAATLISVEHAIGLAFDPNIGIQLYDVNHMTSNWYFYKIVDQEVVGNLIYNSFFRIAEMENNKLALSVSVYISPKEFWSKQNSSSLQTYKNRYLVKLRNTPCYAGINSFLYVACAEDHLEVVKLLLEKGANINQAYKNGTPPLYIAYYNGHLNVAEWLLKNGANVNQTDNNGDSLLLIALKKDHFDVANLLLHYGANVNQVNKSGVSPLYVVCKKGHFEMAGLLLLHYRANVNQADKNGDSPLYVACEKGHFEVAGLLFYNGANVNQVNNGGDSPRNIAYKNGHSIVFKLLCRA